MAVISNTTTTSQMSSVTAREIDFVTRFEMNWRQLLDIMGVSRPIRKQAGTILTAYTASVTLANGAVDEGDETPFSQATVSEAAKTDITIERYAKAVTGEAIAKYGYDVAIEKTDDEFLNELQNKVLGKFYTFLGTGQGTATVDTFQMGLAKAKAIVLEKFANINRTCTEVIGFANITDAYEYLGAANITVQTVSGLNYIENFMGYRTLFLCGSSCVPSGTIYAVPRENIDLYYIDPSDSDFAKAGLDFSTSDGDTNLIGFHVDANYRRFMSESYAFIGMVLFAEYLDGIAKVTIAEVSG